MPRIKNTPKQLASSNPPTPRAPVTLKRRISYVNTPKGQLEVNLFRPATYTVNKQRVVVMNLFDYNLTAEILEFKLSHMRTARLAMDIGKHDFQAHFADHGKYQLTWRFGDTIGFYFSKNGTILDSYLQE